MKLLKALLLLQTLHVILCFVPLKIELGAKILVDRIDRIYSEYNNKVALAYWNFATNITDANQDILTDVEKEAADAKRKLWIRVQSYDPDKIQDEDVSRQLKLLTVLGLETLPAEMYKSLQDITKNMSITYSTGKICRPDNPSQCDWPLDPDLIELMATSDDPNLLKHIWVEWRNAVGPKVREMYKQYVDLANEGAVRNGLNDCGELWLYNYETPDIKEQIEELWNQIKPLYLQLHAYVRFHLKKKYSDYVTENGPIPAHLLGNMWAQNWENIFERTKPYPGKSVESVTDELKKQNYDVKKIFKTAEEFFVSLDFSPMNDLFWKYSLLEKPKDREVMCHPSAHDFSDGINFRITQCTQVNEENFITAHHEMGHVVYSTCYKNLPSEYRTGANEGFHEAIGDTIGLSVSSPTHLRKLQLTTAADDLESELNNLYKMALLKLPLFPFAYTLDLWRWDIFKRKKSYYDESDDYNCNYWKLVEKYQGVEPPVDRSEKDFDPASKFHVVADVPYIRYFTSHIIQFQLFKSLCMKAGEYDPKDSSKLLHQCDFFEKKEAGKALKEMLMMGKSKPWQDAMEVVTGQKKMDASGLLDYFKPLQTWLEKENEKNGVKIGWDPSVKKCTKS